MGSRLAPNLIKGEAGVFEGDARDLTERKQFDLIATSPPYLNAIDYLRGHRLALIWFGYEMSDLREVRGEAIGAEQGAGADEIDVEKFLKRAATSTFAKRQMGWIRRYIHDMDAVFEKLAIAVLPGGTVLIVVGNSFIRGTVVDNAGIVVSSAEKAGLTLIRRRDREIPARRRYLPPPSGGSTLAQRMRSETVLEFAAP